MGKHIKAFRKAYKKRRRQKAKNKDGFENIDIADILDDAMQDMIKSYEMIDDTEEVTSTS